MPLAPPPVVEDVTVADVVVVEAGLVTLLEAVLAAAPPCPPLVVDLLEHPNNSSVATATEAKAGKREVTGMGRDVMGARTPRQELSSLPRGFGRSRRELRPPVHRPLL